MANQNGWKRSKTAKRCNTFPTVWAAIFGCKGEKTTTWRYGVYNMGVQHVEYACATCQAKQDALDAMNRPDHQAELERAQAAAGVENYRYQRTTRVNGVPTLVLK